MAERLSCGTSAEAKPCSTNCCLDERYNDVLGDPLAKDDAKADPDEADDQDLDDDQGEEIAALRAEDTQDGHVAALLLDIGHHQGVDEQTDDAERDEAVGVDQGLDGEKGLGGAAQGSGFGHAVRIFVAEPVVNGLAYGAHLQRGSFGVVGLVEGGIDGGD